MQCKKFRPNGPKLFVSMPSYHGFILTPMFRAFCFGWNEKYQLGLGDNFNRYNLVLHPFFEEIRRKENDYVVKVACGNIHTIVLTNKGKLFGFGCNANQHVTCVPPQEGDDDYQFRLYKRKPMSIPNDFSDTKICNIEVGYKCSFFSTKDGVVYGGGAGAFGELGTGLCRDAQFPLKVQLNDPIIQTESAFVHTIFLTIKKEVFACGKMFNRDGREGMNSGYLGLSEGYATLTRDGDRISTPTKVQVSERIRHIAVGKYHSMLLTEGNEVIVFGSNKAGQLGIETKSDFIDTDIYGGVTSPRKNQNLTNIKTVKTGWIHSVFQTFDNKFYSCGKASYGRLGVNLSAGRRGEEEEEERLPPNVEEEEVLKVTKPILIQTLPPNVDIVDFFTGATQIYFQTSQNLFYANGDNEWGSLVRPCAIEENGEETFSRVPVLMDERAIKRGKGEGYCQIIEDCLQGSGKKSRMKFLMSVVGPLFHYFVLIWRIS